MHVASYILGAIGVIGFFVASVFFDTHATSFYCVFSISVTCSLLSTYFYWRGSTVKVNPEITIYLINRHDGDGFRLIIENTSNEDAYHINLTFELKENQTFPIQQNIYNETFPINAIDGKVKKEISTTIVDNSDRSFNTTWNWKNEKGEKFSRENIVNC
jgi:hypothetical protein